MAKPLSLDVAAAAEGIVRIIEVKMEEAIKAISTMRGHDLRDFMLLAFGGAGPVHAARMARDLGMAGVIVPLYPGVFSALGLLMSDVKHDYIRSRMTPISALTPDDVNAVFAHLETQARDDLRRDGFADNEIRIERALDLRYAGQGYEVTMACTAEQTTALDALRKTFDAEHKALFGHMAPEEPVEVVSYRVRGVGIVPAVAMPKFKPEGRALADALIETRKVRFDGATVPCPVYQREKLDVGLDLARTGHPRSIRLHHGHLRRPDRARRCVEEFDRHAGDVSLTGRGIDRIFVRKDPFRDEGERVTGHRHQIERLETEIHRIVFQQAADDGAEQIHRHDARKSGCALREASRTRCRRTTAAGLAGRRSRAARAASRQSHRSARRASRRRAPPAGTDKRDAGGGC